MKKVVKNIDFKNQKRSRSFFDLVNLKEILEATPKDHNQFEYHKLSFYAIMFITQNKGQHGLNYQEYEYSKGSVFTIRRDSVHKFYPSKSKGKLLVFTENFVVSYLDELQSLKIFQLFNELLGSPKIQLSNADYTEIETLVKQMEKEYTLVKDSFSSEIIRGLLQVLITKLFRIKSREHDVFENKKHLSQFIAFQKLVERDCKKNKKVSYYAKLMNVTPRTLNNITHSIVDKSAKTFINEILITYIKRLLINSELTINEIAYQVGFMETSNLFKYFKKQTGDSPNSFRIKNQ